MKDDERIRISLDSECPEFWHRFGGPPSLSGKRVLEIGCGLGALSIDMARKGAAEVVSVDIRKEDIEAATQYVSNNCPDLKDKVQFTCKPVDDIEITNFDLIVSKDSFEHIIEVPKMLNSIRSHVSDGGRVYIGFSPLYHSPYGDHDRRRAAFRPWGVFGRVLAAIPWGHLLLEKEILKMQSQLQKREISSMQDINLNKMSIGEFRNHISDSDLAIDSFRVNQGNSKIGSLFAILRKIPFLEKLCSYNLYCVLKKNND